MRESDEKLTRLLREARPECGVTPGFAAAVWRRLEAAERAGGGSPEGWLERWVNFWLQPRWALAGAAALLIAGGVAGAVDGSLRGREMARDRYVSSVNPPHAR